MYIINATLEEVISDFDFVDDWINSICENILKKDREKCKITAFYHYGYFVPKRKGASPEQYDMLYEDRVVYEKSKVRVNVSLKIDELMMTNRLKKGMVPKIIETTVEEITKYKMQAEFEFHNNQEIKNSIPPYDESIVSIEIIEKEAGLDRIEEEYFDLDDILDKIQSLGMDSLTEAEKEYLDRKSKEM